MYQINFNKPVKIHFMGIGGISMSGLQKFCMPKALLLSAPMPMNLPLQITWNLLVSKLPMASVPRISHLISMWLFIPLRSILITLNLPLPKQAGIPMMDRADLLGQIMSQLCQRHRRFRYPRQDNNNLYAVSYSSGC